MNIMGEHKMTAEAVIDTCTETPTREEIFGSREDKATNNYWKPISHGSAVYTMMGALEKNDLTVVDSSFALSKSGHMIVGGFQVQGECLPAMPENTDGIHELFFRHANDMSISMQLNAGMSLFVCTNGMMTGERIASRKHTANFHMEEWAEAEAVPNFIQACFGLDDKVQSLQEMPMSNAKAHNLILEAGDKGIIPLARCVDVYREWQNPTFSRADFKEYTGWKLYNNFTHIAQKCSPARQHQIVEQAYELVAN